jgi:acetyl esterase/lipase
MDRRSLWAWFVMTRYLALCLLLTTSISAHGFEAGISPNAAFPIIRIGLVSDEPGTAPAADPGTAPAADPGTAPAAAPDDANACEHVTFSRSLKYGEHDLNVLDVATVDSQQAASRPVLLFVAGESFAGESGAPDIAGPIQDAAMCFAARNGMIGVKMAYRLAPANPWPAGARDVAAATSWVHQNIDLFGGNPNEIVTIGYSAGAFHVASFLAHPEFQATDSSVAGAVLVSGLYHPSVDASASEKSYFGADPSKYDERSAFPGILHVETPLLLAWSATDPPHLVAQGEKLKERLCHAPAHCPHTTVLKARDSLASVFGFDGAGGGLAEPTLELVREIEARGLP